MDDNKKMKKVDNNESNNYMAEAIPLGMCFGVAIGTVVGSILDNIPIWMCVGLSIGVFLGALIGVSIKKDESKK